MRKITALIIVIVVFMPLAYATMTMTSIRPWVLDRGFYERLVSDERLYEGWGVQDFPTRFNDDVLMPDEQLPVHALGAGLREVVSPDYLRGQALHVVDKVFDYIDGRERTFELVLDVTPIKAALAGEGRVRFATALAEALPDCVGGQQPIAPGGSLTRCIDDDGSVDAAAEQIAAALPAVVEDIPDQMIVKSEGYIRMNWYDYAWFLGSGIHTVMDLAIMTMIGVSLAVGMVGAYLGGDDARGRLKWFSAALFAPASLFTLIGLAIVSQPVADLISASMTTARWGAQYSEAFREAVTNVVVPVVQQIGSGVLLTGVITCVIALAVLVVSWATPASGKQSPRFVQVPVRHS